jgi:predicted RNase H-like nuclease
MRLLIIYNGKNMTELDKIIETATESINIITITDRISEEYLREVCEKYHQTKVKNHAALLHSIIVEFKIK